MGPYDSPTFLGRKDKIAMGMTMGQLLKAVCLLMGLLLFWLLLIDHIGLIMCGVGLVVSLIGTIVISTVKVSGVKIPAYLMKMVMMTVRRPAYVADAVVALQSLEPAMDDRHASDAVEVTESSPGLLRRIVSRGKSKAVTAAKDQDNRYLAKAQADAVSANAWVEGRRQVRSLLKEFQAFLPKFRR